MNGRTFFKKFGNIIDGLVVVQNIVPKRIRKYELKRICNKPGKVAMIRRYILLKTLAKYVGRNVAIFQGVYFENVEQLSIGDNVSIHQMCYIDAEGGIDIGNDVSIAHRTTILSSNHGYNVLDVPIKYQSMSLKRTTLKDNIWIGCGCTVLAGVCIESGCVVGANTTVTASIDENSVVVGNPAKIIKKRV